MKYCSPFLSPPGIGDMVGLIALFLMTATALGQNASSEETEIWKLEKAYWDYVKANDLEKYRALWHEDFVGWPLFSPAPVRSLEA
jgi:hypothetical protein